MCEQHFWDLHKIKQEYIMPLGYISMSAINRSMCETSKEGKINDKKRRALLR